MKSPKKPEISTEQVILNAAEQLFLEKGFALTSTVEITKKAQCNQALVHYYYRSKERLFQAVFKKRVILFLSSFLQISKENIPFEEKLKRTIELHFDMLRENPRLPFLLFNGLSTNP
jgi:TetR/AcrR family transcriptional regulator